MELQIYKNAELGSVRTTVIGSEPFFVGKDVAEILGYSNPRKALFDHVNAEDKMDGVTIRDSIGREQKPILINESGLYSLILRSQLPKAQKFKRWVTAEVLPSIRRHGMYATMNCLQIRTLLLQHLQHLRKNVKEESYLKRWQQFKNSR